jgi:DNA-binding transcriptional regulator YiaG
MAGEISDDYEAILSLAYPCRDGTAGKVADRLGLPPASVRLLRQICNLPTEVWASALHTSSQNVEAWEDGRESPDGPATALMLLLATDHDQGLLVRALDLKLFHG